MIDLHDDGFEIANHTYSHGIAGVPLTCERGSLFSYFVCDDFAPGDAMTYFAAEIERDSLSLFLNRPLDSVLSLAYPRHLHSPEIIEALIEEGYLGARYAENSSYSSLSQETFNVPARNSWDGGIFAIYAHHYGDYDDSFGDINYGTSGLTDTDLEWMVNLVRANGGS